METDDEPDSGGDPQREDFARFFRGHWRGILQGLFLFACIFAVLRGTVRTLLDDQVPTAAKHRVETGKEVTDLRIVGWVERDRAPVDLPIHVHFRFTNPSSQPVSLTILDVEAPGFKTPVYLRQQAGGSFPLYVDDSAQPRPARSTALMIPAGGKVDARLEIAAFQRTGSSMVTSLFQWVDTKGAAQHLAFEVGPIRLSSPWIQFFSNSLDTGLSLAQTVALPLVIALFGLLLQQLHQDSVQERQTWASMLPAQQEKIAKLYLPFISSVETFDGWLKTDNPALRPPQEQTPEWRCDEAFFFLLFSVRRIREVDKNGWFSLMEKEWESLLSHLWDGFADRILARIKPYESLSALLDFMAPDETLSSFGRKLRRKAAGSLRDTAIAVESQFQDWRREAAEDFALLSLMTHILEFEMNQVYRFWYSKPPEFPRKACEDLLVKLERRPENQALGEEVRDYLKRRSASLKRARPKPFGEL